MCFQDLCSGCNVSLFYTIKLRGWTALIFIDRFNRICDLCKDWFSLLLKPPKQEDS